MTIDELAGLIKNEFDKVEGSLVNLKQEIKLRPTKTDFDEKINGLKKEIELRPTKKEMFGWADERITDLELRADRHDYLHINELDKLPPQPEISRALVERGFKEKAV